MPRPCEPYHDLRPEKCTLCLLYTTNRRYRQLWDSKGAKRSPSTPIEIRTDCVFLGEFTGEERTCKSCNKVESKHRVYKCGRYGMCTTAKSFADIANCSVCDEYKKKE